VKLFYDADDLPIAAKLRDQRLDWLVELGAEEISRAAAAVAAQGRAKA
jgi:hypothetical protein